MNGRRNDHRLSIFHAIDVVPAASRSHLGRDVKLLQPFLHVDEGSRISGNGDDGVEAVHREKLDWGFLVAAQRNGVEYSGQILHQIAGAAILHIEEMDALIGQRVAVEQCHQLHGAVHVAAAVQQDEQVRRRIGIDFQNVRQLVGGNVLQKDQIHHLFLAGVDSARVFLLEIQRMARNVSQRNDAIHIALFHHAETVDAQNHLEERFCIDILGLAVGVQHHSALHARIEYIVDLQLAGEHIDDFCERRVVQVQTAVDDRGVRGGRGCRQRGSRGR